MTVKELIKELKTLDPNAIVVMSSDAEGNGYSPLDGFYQGFYTPDSTWSGEVHTQQDLDGVEDLDDDSWAPEVTEETVPCIVLCPVN
jgi:hypothetical protein